jgi:hypothetical protein
MQPMDEAPQWSEPQQNFDMVAVATAEQEEEPVARFEDQYLVGTGATAAAAATTTTSSSVMSSVSPPVELKCPTACLLGGSELCEGAKKVCSIAAIVAVPSAYLGCLSDVCLKQDDRFVKHAIADATISAKLFAPSTVSPDAAGSGSANSGVSRLPTPLQCPEYAFGTELWNISPFATTTPFWNLDTLKKVCCVSSMQSSTMLACETIRVGLCG